MFLFQALRLEEESSCMSFSSTAATSRMPHNPAMQGMGSMSGGPVQLNPLVAPGETSPSHHYIYKSSSGSNGEVPRLKPPSPATSAPSTRPLPLPMPMSHLHDGNISISSSKSNSSSRERDVSSSISIRQSLSADSGSGKRVI